MVVRNRRVNPAVTGVPVAHRDTRNCRVDVTISTINRCVVRQEFAIVDVYIYKHRLPVASGIADDGMVLLGPRRVIFAVDTFTVYLHSPNGRHLPAASWGCARGLLVAFEKRWEFPRESKMHCGLSRIQRRRGNPQAVYDSANRTADSLPRGPLAVL